ncbi:methyl-accepting chemotaxis protein [Shewanella sp. JM162201]|uniref:Methyl-accepting chemotaxis protein n=1 Tax=Shewanella jiangmenensis TaxID=2837387 RepID=A0ABS5V156_9GAMM|nr:methyl-accepting chemotaxis protein [Shewanella jiangmenensis]MBT1443501.1 methyl-accepting chemotaxis protein [Shewanella jiangmenensis]
MNSLALKVQVGLAAALFALVSVLFGVSYMIEKQKLEQRFSEYEKDTLASLQVTLAQPVFTYDYEQLNAILSATLEQDQIGGIRVLDHRGKEMAKAGNPDGDRSAETASVEFSDDGKPTGKLEISFTRQVIEQNLDTLLLGLLAQAALILLLSMVAIVLILKKLVINPLTHVAEAMEEVASGDGDLTRRLPVESDDEIGRLARAFNAFIGQIHGTVSRVRETAGQLLDDAKTLGSLSGANNVRVLEQLKQTESSVAAVTELSASASEVASSAHRTADAAASADEQVENSQRQFDESLKLTQQLVDELKRSSGSVAQLQQETARIDEVVVVIRSIAEQTNLLALNAAIEAARAGEQGRGFAVVADEVRTLASRTQQATGEIQQMIQKVQSRVGETVSVMNASQSLSDKTLVRAEEIKSMLASVTALVSNINMMNTEVAQAAREQTCVTEDISRSLNDLAGISGSASADSASLAQSGERLFQQGERLQALVNSFRL